MSDQQTMDGELFKTIRPLYPSNKKALAAMRAMRITKDEYRVAGQAATAQQTTTQPTPKGNTPCDSQ